MTYEGQSEEQCLGETGRATPTEGTGVPWAADSAADIGPMSETKRGTGRDTLWTLATHESIF